MPRQVFAVGLNYRDHALGEAGLKELPTSPLIFTKFPTCIAGPYDDLPLPVGNVDWEIELVAVIGTRASRVSVEDALDHVAGYAVGQDFSERLMQLSGGMPQFSLGKSFPGFGPFGPWLVTLDALDETNGLAVECTVNGVKVQGSDTSQLIFPVNDLVSRLSHVCTLLPGDVIFTGTPAGVGNARNPKWFLKPGDEVVSTIAQIGSIKQTCVADPCQ
nr:unnamed protein product [Sphingomonas sp.]